MRGGREKVMDKNTLWEKGLTAAAVVIGVGCPLDLIDVAAAPKPATAALQFAR
jgi:hypothetical protein